MVVHVHGIEDALALGKLITDIGTKHTILIKIKGDALLLGKIDALLCSSKAFIYNDILHYAVYLIDAVLVYGDPFLTVDIFPTAVEGGGVNGSRSLLLCLHRCFNVGICICGFAFIICVTRVL